MNPVQKSAKKTKTGITVCTNSNRAGVITAGKTGRKIITVIRDFTGNPYDGHAIKPLLNRITGHKLQLSEELAYDRGCKGEKEIPVVKIIIPDKPKKINIIRNYTMSFSSLSVQETFYTMEVL